VPFVQQKKKEKFLCIWYEINKYVHLCPTYFIYSTHGYKMQWSWWCTFAE